MTRRKGELTPAGIDRGWPHQVAMPYEQCTGKNYEAPHAFCRGLSLCSRNHQVLHDGQQYLVFCFADLEDAVQLREAFGGFPFYPEDRKGRNWNRPPGDKRRPRKPTKRDMREWYMSWTHTQPDTKT